jgi:proton-coupled amino acid transporter
MVGPAILYLPHGFASAGYLVALPIMFVCTTLFLYSSKCLLDAWKLESNKMNNSMNDQEASEGDTLLNGNGNGSSNSRRRKSAHRQRLSYPELAYRAFGSRGESLVKAGIALMQSGVCLTYLIFVPQNLHASVLQLSNQKINIPPETWLILMVACQVPLSWIRDIRKLTPTNALANALILYGLITCLCFAMREATTPDNTDIIVIVGNIVTTQDTVSPVELSQPPLGALGEIWKHFMALPPFNKDWYLFIGTSVLMFEGSITLLVPLQEAVHSDKEREAFPEVYRKVILGIICFYAFFGITCWMAFGNDVKTVLTTSLPVNALATTVQLAYSLAVVFTFPLQNFPALEIACRTIQSVLSPGEKGSGREQHFYTRRNVISSVLVALLAVVAVCTMNSLDKVVSLMGSLLGCPIAFVFPPMIHSQLDPNLSVGRQWGNRITALFGLVAMVLASTTTLLTWK